MSKYHTRDHGRSATTAKESGYIETLRERNSPLELSVAAKDKQIEELKRLLLAIIIYLPSRFTDLHKRIDQAPKDSRKAGVE